MTDKKAHSPKDVQVIQAILKDMGITDYEPRVITQILEFSYKYVSGILEDARVYSNHAKKKQLDLDDVKLAAQLQIDKTCTTPPPRDFLLELSRHRNAMELPAMKAHSGLRLPPDRYCLTSTNYKIKPIKKQVPRLQPGRMAGTPLGVNQKIKANVTAARIKTATIPGTRMLQPSGVPQPVLKLSSDGAPATIFQTVEAQEQFIKVESGLKRKRDDDDDYDV